MSRKSERALLGRESASRRGVNPSYVLASEIPGRMLGCPGRGPGDGILKAKAAVKIDTVMCLFVVG